MNRSGPWLHLLLSAALLSMAAGPLAATTPSPVRPLWEPAGWVRADEAVELEIAGDPAGRVAIFLGATDLTDLFHRRGARWVYRPELLPLAAGESELVVWSVGPDGWRELGRAPLRVLHRGGLEQRELAVRLDVEALTEIDSGGSDPPPATDHFTGQLDLQQRLARSGWSFRLAANVVGVSEAAQALRFAQEGERADRVDLSSWSLELGRNRFELGLGHLTWGDSQQLVQAVTSRGVRLRIPLGPPAEVSLVAMNGSSIVGWGNPLGLARDEHQLQAASVGLELRPARPGALRFEVTLLDGSLLPEPGFNQAHVDDREQSRGWSARLLAAPTSRLRLDAAFARSEFDNPEDPQLGQGAELVPVASERRDAHYLDFTWSLLQRQSEGGKLFDLALDLDHRRVEPLYRSVGAFVQSDLEEGAAQLRLQWGGTSGMVSMSRSRDNLDDLPSVLTTRTRRAAWSFAIPFTELVSGEPPSPWLPLFTLAGERTHQFGEGVPVNADFAASHVPDQVSLAHQFGLRWNGAKWSLAAAASLADQDNRQPGRERADFGTDGVSVSFFTSPHHRLDLGLDWRLERQDNEELGQLTTLSVVGFNWTLRLPRHHLLAGSLSRTESDTEPGIRTSDDLLGELQWAWGFERRQRQHGLSGRIFLRASYRDADSVDRLFGFVDRRDGWAATAGLAVSAF